MATTVNRSLQESILTLLCHSDEHGRIILNTVEPDLFDGDYRVICARAVEYWRAHGKAPKAHMADLLGDIINDKHNRKAATYRQILMMMFETVKDLNPPYVIGALHQFIRTQRLTSAIITSAEKIEAQREMAIGEIEEMWQDLLRAREIAFEPGLRLSQWQPMLDYFNSNSTEFSTGIPEFDNNYFRPMRGRVMLMIAPSGYGKSWWLIHLGKRALLARKKVCHITLEMDAEEVSLRYYQALFGVPKREAEEGFKVYMLEKRKGIVTGFTTNVLQPDFSFSRDGVEAELQEHTRWLGARADNLLIKRFPGASLTMNELRAYLDHLEAVESFVPDLVILDYIGITKIDRRDPRFSLGANMVEFRAILQERNIAGITAQQASKKGDEASYVRSRHVAEDWSLIGTSDMVITYSRTSYETNFNLARLYVEKMRSEVSGYGLLITQNYPTGQFVLDSARLTDDVQKLIDELTKSDSDAANADE